MTFDQATQRTLRAMNQRITQLRDKIANSEAADKARATLDELESKREQLAKRMQELGETTTDKLSDAKQAVVDGITDLNERLRAAWAAFAEQQ